MNKKYFFLFLIFVLSSFLYFVHAQNSHLSKEKLLALKKVELNIKDLYNELNAAQYDLSFEAFRYAYIGYQSLRKQHRLNEKTSSLLLILQKIVALSAFILST